MIFFLTSISQTWRWKFYLKSNYEKTFIHFFDDQHFLFSTEGYGRKKQKQQPYNVHRKNGYESCGPIEITS